MHTYEKLSDVPEKYTVLLLYGDTIDRVSVSLNLNRKPSEFYSWQIAFIKGSYRRILSEYHSTHYVRKIQVLEFKDRKKDYHVFNYFALTKK